MLEAGTEELGDWPLLAAIRKQFGAQEAMLRAELGDRTGALRALGNGSSGAASLAGAVVLAKLQLGDGDWEAARETVSAWSEERETARDAGRRAGVAGRGAGARRRRGPRRRGGRARTRARARRAGGLRSALLDFGRSLAPLLGRQLRRGTAHRALVGELLAALDGANGSNRPHPPFMIEPLSPRERAVLRYLPTMMSNQEIASSCSCPSTRSRRT